MDGAACVQLCSDPPIFKYKLTALTFRICLVFSKRREAQKNYCQFRRSGYKTFKISFKFRINCYSYWAFAKYVKKALQQINNYLISYSNLINHLFIIFINFLYMFRAILCSSSGGFIVYIQHLFFVCHSENNWVI